ncbi:hypothetical protein [Wolbachia endosymbiont of Mansonella ozzardi]|uniref:hypothetical protein n=1 Tax=Wolbachia endosymbiont of Mansonella ozzardi TaxID=137464 RepID=UPI001CE1BC30|nr:hypothetical protein [Wolbachia endosymbiont of Mansonella ozzardi]
MMKIEHTTFPNNRDIEFLSKGINEENADKGTCNPFAFFIHDDARQIIAGCISFISMVQFILICFGCITTIRKKVWESS